MKDSYYESHVYSDQNLPIIFHMDVLENKFVFMPHWHENIELLFFLEGVSQVTINGITVTANPGELVVVNPNSIHHIKALQEESKYYCLIIDNKLFQEFLLKEDTLILVNKISDSIVKQFFEAIALEFKEQNTFYKSAIKLQTMSLILHLYRNYLVNNSISIHNTNSKIMIVKQAINYIQRNYSRPISTEDIAKDLKFSKYYLCHIFKETTDYSLVKYLNLCRCMNAKKLLMTQEYNVGEVMTLCGYDNLSYFTRTYKKYMGVLPSKDRNQ